ncbi:MAG TPA: CinA family nicotinamide mononucleotide deamidase-related protein, partial [Anaeromyxobacteraceae bacterium]
RKTLVGDDRTDLVAALAETTARADVVVMSGGLGPTEDDLTAECVAQAMGVLLVLDEASLAAIRARFEKLGRTMTPNNAKQARFPRGATILPNRLGTAPGFLVRLGRGELVCLPGVPVEYKGLCEEVVLPRIAARAGEVPAARLVKLIGIPESHADEAMRPVMDAPEHRGVRFGYRAHWPEIHVKWSVPGPEAEAHAERILGEVRRIFGDAIFAEGKAELPQGVLEALTARGERLALAESCTGGLVAQLLTSVPGASAVLEVGAVVYGNDAKTAVLGVPEALLAAHGAVSEPVARAMAEGARRLGSATWGLAVTGIAGPGGGTPEKPVGTVHLAIAGPDGTRTWARRFPGDRERVRKTSAYDLLNQLRLLLR